LFRDIFVVVEATSKSAAGEVLDRQGLRPTYYETSMVVVSQKEITREAISRILRQAAW